ncbi:MAG: hypothetical protein P8N94_02505 [Gammaproteobacteria bacterium]|nr:hypothetical protein [Gammaproteobacteria bacterium]
MEAKKTIEVKIAATVKFTEDEWEQFLAVSQGKSDTETETEQYVSAFLGKKACEAILDHFSSYGFDWVDCAYFMGGEKVTEKGKN